MSERDKAIEEQARESAFSKAFDAGCKITTGNYFGSNTDEKTRAMFMSLWESALDYHAKQNAEAEKRLEEAVRSLEESIVDLRGYTITRHSLSALNIFNRAEEFLKQLDAIRAVYTHLEQAEGGKE